MSLSHLSFPACALITLYCVYHGYFLHPPNPSYFYNFLFPHSNSHHLCGVITYSHVQSGAQG